MSTITQPSRALPPTAGRAREALRHLGWGRLRHTPMLLFWALIAVTLVLPILLFLAVAFSPRLLDQGPQWFTLSGFSTALHGSLLRGLLDSLGVGVAAAAAATALGFAVAWLVQRTDVPGRRAWSAAMFALLLAPSYLVALGIERLLEPSGVLEVMGWDAAWLRGLFYGPFGVTAVLTVKGVPFAYLAISSALRGLGDEFEAAVRVYGGGTAAVAKVVTALLAPAIWSAVAIVFAESISDFGVAATLANDAHFPVATYVLYNAIDSFPVRFPVAAAVSWLLMLTAGLALLAQSRALRGRSYQILGGRTRAVRRHRLSPRRKAGAVALLATLVGFSLGIPIFGAVSASLINGLGTLVGGHAITLSNYRRVLDEPALRSSLLFSAKLAVITATVAVVLAAVAARLLSKRGGGRAARLLDLTLLTAVALPGIVFAAGYIFAYNLPLTNTLGIHLYGTTTLLVLGYLATALPSTSRVLIGAVSQAQDSLRDAARAHGTGAVGSWLRAVAPLLARPLIAAWVLTFSGTLLELPVSQLLYPPGHPPVSVGITHALSNYDFGGGTAMEVLAVLFALVVVGATWLAFGLLAPRGWRRVGAAS